MYINFIMGIKFSVIGFMFDSKQWYDGKRKSKGYQGLIEVNLSFIVDWLPVESLHHCFATNKI